MNRRWTRRQFWIFVAAIAGTILALIAMRVAPWTRTPMDVTLFVLAWAWAGYTLFGLVRKLICGPLLLDLHNSPWRRSWLDRYYLRSMQIAFALLMFLSTAQLIGSIGDSRATLFHTTISLYWLAYAGSMLYSNFLSDQIHRRGIWRPSGTVAWSRIEAYHWQGFRSTQLALYLRRRTLGWRGSSNAITLWADAEAAEAAHYLLKTYLPGREEMRGPGARESPLALGERLPARTQLGIRR